MTPGTPPPRLDLEAGAFHDLTLAFDAFYRRPSGIDGLAMLSRRHFLRCNLTGPVPVSLGPGVRFSDCIFSACAFTALPDVRPAPGSIMLDDCNFDDCVLTRWSIFLPPSLLPSLLQDMPRVRVFGLPFR